MAGSHCPWICEVVGKVVLRVALCIHRCIRPHTFYASDRFHFLYSLARCIYLFTKVYSELPRSRDDACLGGGYFIQVL